MPKARINRLELLDQSDRTISAAESELNRLGWPTAEDNNALNASFTSYSPRNRSKEDRQPEIFARLDRTIEAAHDDIERRRNHDALQKSDIRSTNTSWRPSSMGAAYPTPYSRVLSRDEQVNSLAKANRPGLNRNSKIEFDPMVSAAARTPLPHGSSAASPANEGTPTTNPSRNSHINSSPNQPTGGGQARR
jgi:hypothetical protein